MFLTLLTVFFLQGTPINQTKMTEAGKSHGITIHYTQPKPVATFKMTQPTPVATFHLEK